MNNKTVGLNCNGSAASVPEEAMDTAAAVAKGITPAEPILREPSPVRAAIIGDDTCTADNITVRGYAPTFALCRRLIAAGYATDRPLHAYRNDTLSLRIGSLGEGARLTVKDNRFGTPVLHRWRGPCLGAATASPMRQNVGAARVVHHSARKAAP